AWRRTRSGAKAGSGWAMGVEQNGGSVPLPRRRHHLGVLRSGAASVKNAWPEALACVSVLPDARAWGLSGAPNGPAGVIPRPSPSWSVGDLSGRTHALQREHSLLTPASSQGTANTRR